MISPRLKSAQALLVLLSVLPLGVASALMLVTQTRALQEWGIMDLKRDVRVIAEALAHDIESAVELDRQGEMMELNSRMAAATVIMRAFFIREDGSIGWQYARPPSTALAESPADGEGGDAVTCSFRVADLLGAGRSGTVAFVASDEGIQANVRRSLALMGTIALVAIGIALTLSWRIARRLARAMKATEESVRQVAESHDYGLTLPDVEFIELQGLVQGFQHLMREVDQRKKDLDIEVQLNQEIASRSEAERMRLSTLIETMPTGILLLAWSGELLYLNQTLCEIFEVEREALEGKHRSELARLLSKRTPAIESALMTLFQSPIGRHSVRDVELEVGDHLKLKCLTVPTQPGESSEVLVLFRDVTLERRAARLEEGLRHAQKMESMGRLASSVSHDFNNVLTAIQGFAQLALRATPEDDPNRDNIEEILSASGRAKAVTDKLLLLSRRQGQTLQAVHLGRLLVPLKTMLAQLLPTHEISLGVTEDCGYATVDPGELEQVIMNLSVNAGDAMEEGGTLSIHASRVNLQHSVSGTDDYVSISVSDTGCGIPEDQLAQVFEPFYTTKDAGSGTGQGLATVVSIIEGCGGFVDIDSKEGRGTKVTVYLKGTASPADASDEQEAGAAELDGAALAPNPVGGRVLLVEDSDLVRRATAMMLREAGFEVTEAANGEEALEFAADEGCGIDLLLTDVVMPGMRGPEVAMRVRALRPDVPVIIMSGYDEDLLAPGTEASSYPRLNKPFSYQELTLALQQLLGA